MDYTYVFMQCSEKNGLLWLIGWDIYMLLCLKIEELCLSLNVGSVLAVLVE